MKVLIVDDEDIVRRALTRAFQLAGHEVYQASGGLEGIKIWTEVQPDVVFLDVLMPGLSGLQVLKEIGEKKVGKVILMSANSAVLGVGSPNQVGADEFLSKPFEDIFSIVKMAEKWTKDFAK